MQRSNWMYFLSIVMFTFDWLNIKMILSETKFNFKDIDHCPIEIIKGLTDKGQFQNLTKLIGPQEGTYLYTTQFHSLG